MHRAEACTADGRGLTRSCVRPESLQAQGGGSRAAALRHGAAQSGLKACPPAASARQLQQLQQFEYHLCMQLLSSPREVQFWRPTRVMEALPAGSAEAAAGRGNGGLEISGKQAGRPSSQPAQSRAGGQVGQAGSSGPLAGPLSGIGLRASCLYFKPFGQRAGGLTHTSQRSSQKEGKQEAPAAACRRHRVPRARGRPEQLARLQPEPGRHKSPCTLKK